jgi:hypothetical protein
MGWMAELAMAEMGSVHEEQNMVLIGLMKEWKEFVALIVGQVVMVGQALMLSCWKCLQPLMLMHG